MGTQQLLLVVLGLIVISVAIAIANNLFSSQAENSAKDSIANELVNLATVAQQYFAKPSEVGGGGKDFSDWIIPSGLDTTNSGTYQVVSGNDTQLVIMGSPLASMNYDWKLKSIITRSSVVTEIVY